MRSPISILSFLGTSDYEPCWYWFEDGWIGLACTNTQEGTRIGFMLPLIIQWIRQKYGDCALRISICCTNKSREKNFMRLEKAIRELLDSGDELSEIRIPEGRTVAELYENFHILEQEIPDKADIVLDVTHAYRSIPVVAIAISEYLRATKSVKIQHILYGAYEAGEQGSKGRENYLKLFHEPTPMCDPQLIGTLPPNLLSKYEGEKDGIEIKVAPVLELNELVTIINWASMSRLFESLGDPAVFVSAITDKKLSEWFERMGSLLELGHIRYLQDEKTIEPPQIRNSFPRPVHSLIKRVISQVRILVQSELDDSTEALLDIAFKIIQHYHKHKRYFHMISLMRETTVLLLLVQGLGQKLDGTDSENRKRLEDAEQLLRSWTRKRVREAKTKFGESSPEVTVIELFDNIVKIRNEAMHCGLSYENQLSPKRPQDVKTKLEGLFEKLKLLRTTLNRSTGENLTAGLSAPQFSNPIFMNISNHPSNEWSKDQREAALKMLPPGGRIIDIVFPSVDPLKTDTEYVNELVEKVISEINNLSGRPQCAMVQGEHVLTAKLVAHLQSLGIRCFAATTERLVETRPDGTKVSQFTFRGFREYPPLALQKTKSF